MQANSLVTILALFQLLCGLTLAQNHSIGSKNEMPQSLVEGRHVGLDVYDLLTEALMRASPELATPEAYRPPGHWLVVSWSRQFASIEDCRASGVRRCRVQQHASPRIYAAL
jgi:hypothetical protein